ncbi:hypothetical protein SELMODRAFT_441144 [Selaginella moellendorffii]|uniref:PHD-type domain-containing protein n=2 Tax=Selaginella moellendorffii TaxID=88036 RepID=D8RGW2_SELML|nr:DDT domain-containing protein PTM isoform X1 [Selaginella moellendorffii]EFJ28659.1 hypothetical protein SELMODRAFT_441144 [Selaginella moellendorffii]|eukprot:XP_002970529.1 DDT domain-containing protein PTM isoform X1 [Selaginella moellendorffii]
MEEEEDNAELVGRSVRKYFQGHGYFGGTVVAYDKSSKYFRVKYADGDREEVELHELREILVDCGSDSGAPPKRSRGRPRKIADANGTNGELIQAMNYKDLVAWEVAKALKRHRPESEPGKRPRGRPRKKPRQEEKVLEKEEETKEEGQETKEEETKILEKDEEEKNKPLKPVAHRRKSSLADREYPLRLQQRRKQEEQVMDRIKVDDGAERKQKEQVMDRVKVDGGPAAREEVECHKTEETDLNVPALPPSSVNLNIPTESVFHLFSAFTFLRSFSWVIFLSPFSLQQFICCLTLKEANPLVDQIHLSLLVLLRQHLESLASDGIESAINCLRCRDWTLLDAVAWPSYLIAYLVNGNYRKEGKERLLDIGILRREYYGLEVGSKIDILSFLCDRVLDTDEVRSELAKRSNGDSDLDPLVKASVEDSYLEQPTKRETRRSRKSSPSDTSELVDPPTSHRTEPTEQKHTSDWNSDDCVLCGMDGNLICCDGCPAAYHSRCVGVSKSTLPEGDWYCPECTLQKIALEGTRARKVVRGFECFGIDTYRRRYIAACEHLFISESSSLDSSYVCYGPGDISSVLDLLDSTGALSASLRTSIMQCWNLSEDSAPKNDALLSPIQDTICVLNGSAEDELVTTDKPFGSSKLSRCTGMHESFYEASSYINQYSQGGLSALAASNLAEKSTNRRAAVQKTQIFEQIKAFSRTPVQFYWPSLKKKRAETAKDRCGWCFACKNLSRKKGCLLNTAAGKLCAGAAIVTGGLRLIKKGVNHLPALIAYVLYMEDRLYGLLGGLWESTDQRNRWRRRLDCAAHVHQVKFGLLELGSSLRPLALSRNWSICAEDAPRLGTVNGNVFVSSLKKSGGRRRKKVQADDPIKIFPGGGTCGVQWRRGGKLVRRILDWETLPVAALKRAGRQGGIRKVPGLIYNDYFELPRRTVQCAWLARVEASFSVSELAIQVRSLDALIRWSELLVPDEVKTSFGEFTIREKAMEDDITKYRVETSKTEDELTESLKPDVVNCASKFVKALAGEEGASTNSVWLPETEVPLCLVREFEEKRRRFMQPKKPAAVRKGERARVSKSTKLKAILNRFHSKKKALRCEHCNMDLAASDTVSCQECQGDFHKQCLSGKTGLCQSCFTTKQSTKRSRRLLDTAEESPPEAAVKDRPVLLVYSRRKKLAVTAPAIRAAVIRKRRSKRPGNTSGVRWKLDKKLTFRRDMVVYPGQKLDGGGLRCAICEQPYDAKLLYIGCEHCQGWFHGRAVGITSSNIARVDAFKCHKCRKKGSPYCPFTPKTKENVTPVRGREDVDNERGLRGRGDKASFSYSQDDDEVLTEIGNWSGGKAVAD